MQQLTSSPPYGELVPLCEWSLLPIDCSVCQWDVTMWWPASEAYDEGYGGRCVGCGSKQWRGQCLSCGAPVFADDTVVDMAFGAWRTREELVDIGEIFVRLGLPQSLYVNGVLAAGMSTDLRALIDFGMTSRAARAAVGEDYGVLPTLAGSATGIFGPAFMEGIDLIDMAAVQAVVAGVEIGLRCGSCRELG